MEIDTFVLSYACVLYSSNNLSIYQTFEGNTKVLRRYAAMHVRVYSTCRAIDYMYKSHVQYGETQDNLIAASCTVTRTAVSGHFHFLY